MTTVQKWGNSLAVRIPATLADQMHLEAGVPVEVSEDAADTVLSVYDFFADPEENDEALDYAIQDVSNPALFDAVVFDPATGDITLSYAADAAGTSDITLRA